MSFGEFIQKVSFSLQNLPSLPRNAEIFVCNLYKSLKKLHLVQFIRLQSLVLTVRPRLSSMNNFITKALLKYERPKMKCPTKM